MDFRTSGGIRCKACDRKFQPSWNDKMNSFEDLCWKCLGVSRHASQTDAHLYGDNLNSSFNPDQWISHSTPGEDKAFVEGYLYDKQGDAGDLWKEDTYLEYGESAFGDLGYFDGYGDE